MSGKIFEEKYKEIVDIIGDKQIGALATNNGSFVTCRTMSLVFIDGEILFQTDVHSCKARQIDINPNVAISFDAFEIIGKAKMIGHPLSKECSYYYRKYKMYFPEAEKKYSNLEVERFYMVTPSLIKFWSYSEAGAMIEEFDLNNRNYKRKILGY